MINWGLAQDGNSALSMFGMGAQMGQQIRQRREEKERRGALAAYASDPTEETFAAAAQYDPGAAIGIRNDYAATQRQETAAKQEEAARAQAQAGQMRQLLKAAGENPQQALMAAQQMGIDTSAIPAPDGPEFEPWRQTQMFILGAMETPEGKNLMTETAKQVMLTLPPDQRDVNNPAFIQAFTEQMNIEARKTIAYEPGGGVATYDPRTGKVTPVVVPYGQGQAPQSEIPSAAIEALKRGEGTAEQFDQMFGPGAAARIMGEGGGSNVTADFLQGL